MLDLTAVGIIDYLTYLVGTIAVILLPGPNSMYCLYVSAKQSAKHGYVAMLGILLGDTILMLAAVLGAATLLKTSAMLFTIFKALGGLYLAYLGVQLLIGAYRSWQNRTSDMTKNEALNAGTSQHRKIKTTNKTLYPRHAFVKALTLSLSNPKAILFFLSFFLQFVDPTYAHPFVSFAILGLTLQIISMIYLTVLIQAGAWLAEFFRSHYRISSVGQASIGALFLTFATSLWRAKAN